MILLATYDVGRDLGGYMPPNEAANARAGHRRVPNLLIAGGLPGR
jgi:hypothetical protein